MLARGLTAFSEGLLTPVSTRRSGAAARREQPIFLGPLLTPVTRRSLALVALGGAALPLLAQTRRADAVVGGSGRTHDSLAAALAAAPAGDSPWRIQLAAGVLREKVIVRRANVTLTGAGRTATTLVADHHAGGARPEGGNWGTYGSATLTVEAPGFAASDLRIENGFDYVAGMRAGVTGSQAVALALGDHSDRSRIARCDIIGHQDSLYLREGRAVVSDCLIAGSVDFIFGGARALFSRCEIRSRLRPGETVQGYVAAPSTLRDEPVGFVFDRCRLTREAGVPDGSVWLGRPWRAGGDLRRLGHSAFLDCWMDAHIRSEGWTWMGYRGPGGQSLRLEAGDARFFEFGSRGPGGVRAAGRRQLDAAGAARLRRNMGMPAR